MEVDEPNPTKASVGRVRPFGFVYNLELGRIECLRCGGRAFTRCKAMIEVWERAHQQCCRRKDKPTISFCA